MRVIALISWSEDEQLRDLPPNSFVANEAFVARMHRLIGEQVHRCPETCETGRVQHVGHLHVADERAHKFPSRIPLPQDILGTVKLDEGRIVPGSYEPMMQAHRLLTSHGLAELPCHMEQRLLAELQSEQ
jgi:hypothetical protein